MFQYLDFLSSNKLIKYPFFEGVELPSEIPTDFFLDIAIVAQEDATYYVNRIDVLNDHYDIYINDNLFVVPIIRSNNNVYEYSSATVSIKVIIGTNKLQLVPGSHTFTEGQTSFEPCCVTKYQAAVSSIEVNGESLTGNIKILSGYNCELTIDEETNQIELQAYSGAGEGRPTCEDVPYENVDRKPIYTINTTPYPDGFYLVRSECVEVQKRPAANMVFLNDICKPCCEDCEDTISNAGDEVVVDQATIAVLSARITALGG